MTELVNYGELMDAEEERLKPAARTSTDYSAMMDTEAEFQRQRLAGALTQAKSVAPDTYAKTVAGAKSLGLPPAAVEGAPEDAQQKLILQQADALMKNSPRLAEKMASPEFAKLAHDDTESLSMIEGIKNGWARGWRTLLQSPSAINIRSVASNVATLNAIASGEKITPGLRGEDPLGMRFDTTPEIRDVMKGELLTSAGESAGRMAGLQLEKQGVPVDPIVEAAQQAKSFSDFWYYFKQKPLDYIATVGAESLPSSAPGMIAAIPAGIVGGPAGAAAALGTGSLIQDYTAGVMQALQESGVDITNKDAIAAAVRDQGLMERVGARAAAHAIGVATFDAVSGGIAGKPLIRTAVRAGGKPLVREALNLAVQAPVQGTLGALGEAVGSVMSGQEIQAGDVMSEFFGEFAGTPGEVLSASAGRIYEHVRTAEAAAHNGLVLQQLAELAKASKLAERDPQSFGEFVQAAAEDGPVTDVYIDGRQLVHTLDQAGLDETALPQAAREQLVEAVRMGGDVRIPIGEYTANLANSDVGAQLLPHLKVDPEAMTQHEAQSFLQEHFEAFKEQTEKELGKHTYDAERQNSVDLVKTHFMNELGTANRFTPEVNAAYALMMSAFYNVMSQRLGITPVEMLQRYPVRVVAENVAREVMMEQQHGAHEPQEMKPGDINKELDRLDKESSAITDEMIATGRGNEKPSETRTKTDPLSVRFMEVANRSAALRDEISARYGPAAPSRFPSSRGFAPRKQPAVLQQSSRGQIAFDNIRQGAMISLLKNADLSTFIHESGHLYLEILMNIAAQQDAPADLVTDAQKVLAWFGVKGNDKQTALEVWRGMTLEQKRPMHEQFARGFEAYLFEGKAPNLELQSLFGRFRAWLLNVYKSIQALNVEISSDVRSVFDRMLASGEEIRAAEGLRAMAPMFTDAKEASATEAEWQNYLKLGMQSTEDAVLQLERRSLGNLRWLQNAHAGYVKKLQDEANAKRAAIRTEVEAEVLRQPIYAAMEFLKHGTVSEGKQSNARRKLLEITGMEGHRLSMKALRDMYGEDASAPWRFLDTGSVNGVITHSGGLHPDLVAELFGMTSGDELVRKLVNVEPMGSVVEGMTDQRMLERHGDLADENAVSKAADRAVHNEARGRFIAAELRFLDRVANPRAPTGQVDVKGRDITVNVLAKAAKQFAEQIISRKKLKDIKPAQYAAAEARAAKAALVAKNPREKAIEKRNQLVNNYAARAAEEAVSDVEKGLRYLKKFDNEGTRKNVDQDYLDQIDQLLERFDLRKASQAEVAKRASLREWMEEQRALGFEPTIDKALEAEANRQHYSTLSLEEFRGLLDAVRNIEHIGRLKKKLLTAKDQREYAAVVEELRSSIEQHATGTVKERKSSDRGPLVSIGNFFRQFTADHRKFASLAREMDGWKDGGRMWERLVRTMNDAGNAEASAREKATIKLTELLKPILRGEKLSKKAFVNAIGKSLTREERIGIALNMGNEVNVERVMTGEKWTRPQLNAILDTLTKQEWDFVQSVWDYLESFRPEIAAKSKRVTGVEPAFVEPATVQTKFGAYKGGYYPIKYDPLRSSRAEADTAAEVQRQMERGLYVRAQTRRGHLEERVKSTGRAMRYDFGSVIASHVDQVVHDLSWHEWLIDSNRLMRSLDAPIREYYGPEKLRTMKDTLRDIAVGDMASQTSGDRLLTRLRHGATIVGLGWRLSTALLQPIGLTQSMSRIGTKWVLRGAKHWFGDAMQFDGAMKKIHDKSEFMRLRSKTMQREISEIRNKVGGTSASFTAGSVVERIGGQRAAEALEGSYFYLIHKLQGVADVPTWWGAYEKAMHENGMNESRAVALADQAVIDAQGSGQIKDLAAIQRGSPAWKLFTNFYSFFNTTYNLTRESVGRTNFRSVSSIGLMAADLALLYTIPALLGTLMKATLKGDWDDEDKLARRLIADQISYMLGTVVVLRELGGFGQKALGLQGPDYSGPASVRLFSAIEKLGKQAEQGELDAGFWKALNETSGLVFHYPAGQINSTLDGLTALVDGDTQNPGVLITGAKH